jgi:hypothetical protein
VDFLDRDVDKFEMYVEDDHAVFMRYCFADPLDATVSARGSSKSPSASGWLANLPSRRARPHQTSTITSNKYPDKCEG